MDIKKFGSIGVGVIDNRSSGIQHDDHSSNSVNMKSERMPTQLARLEHELGLFNDLNHQIDDLARKIDTKPEKSLKEKFFALIDTFGKFMSRLVSRTKSDSPKESVGNDSLQKQAGVERTVRFDMSGVEGRGERGVREFGKDVGALTRGHITQTAEKKAEQLKDRLHGAEPMPKTGIEWVSTDYTTAVKTDSLEKFSNKILQIKERVVDRFNELSNDGGVTATVDNKTYTRDEFLKLGAREFVQHIPAGTFYGTEGTKIGTMAENLGQEDKAFAKEIGKLVEHGKTPRGSIELFGWAAMQAVRTHKENTFLRDTNDVGTACIRKIVIPNGGQEYEAKVRIEFTKMQDSEVSYTNSDGKSKTFKISDFSNDLAKLQEKSTNSGTSVKNFKDGGITTDIALKCCAVAKKMMEVMGDIALPPDMKTVLGEFQSGIDQNPAQGDREKMKHNLFGDQIGLKIVSPLVLKEFGSSLAVKHGAEVLQTTANGSDKVKYQGDALTVYKANVEDLTANMNSAFEKYGMSI